MVTTSSIDQSWSRIGRYAGYLAGAAFLVGTILFLLDALELLGATPEFHATAAGPLQDEANFWVADFVFHHDIVWDIIARDLILPLGFVALMVLGLAIRHFAGKEDPRGELMLTFLVVGGVISAIADLIFLGNVEYWRVPGLTAHPPESTIAIGRATQAIDSLTRWPEAAGFAIVAIGIVYVGRLCASRLEFPATIALLAYAEALLLLGIAVSGAAQMEAAYQSLALLAGVLVGPTLVLAVGRHLGRRSRVGGGARSGQLDVPRV